MKKRIVGTTRWGTVGILAAPLAVVGVLAACSASDPAPATSTEASCNDYCTRILANCTGSDTMYRDMDQCTSACKALDPANQTAAQGNTIKCRQAQLDAKNCKGAGALGGGVCGQRCDGFCKIAQAACGKEAAPPYPDLGTCLEECSTVLKFDPNAAEGVEQAFTGADTLNCRVQHLMLAFMNPNPHCNHIAVQSAQCRNITDAGGD